MITTKRQYSIDRLDSKYLLKRNFFRILKKHKKKYPYWSTTLLNENNDDNN